MRSEPSPSGSNQLWELVPKAVSTIVSLSALGYFIGWRETQAYYTAIGAGWAAASVPPLTLLQKSANTIVAMAFGAFISLVLLSDNKISTRKLSWACALFFLASAACLLASQGTFGELPSTAAYSFASVGSLLCAVAAGVTLAEWYGHARASQASISSGHLWLVYWIVLPGLFWAPDRLGQAQSLRDMDVTHSPLPIVLIDPTQSAGTWRLVQLLQDKALLVKLDTKEINRQFKVVEAKDIQSIAFTPVSGTQK
jgi:hypothetical protein